MKPAEQRRALTVAVQAAEVAGRLLRRHLHAAKTVHSATQHDIKLELDVRCQTAIERLLLAAYPQSAILGEEGVHGQADADLRWVVDPIDGTVNFTYGVPHACVSIALQEHRSDKPAQAVAGPTRTRPSQRPRARPGARPSGQEAATYTTLVGVVYDPFCRELWTATRGHPARLNGRVVRASDRRRLREAVISLGFGKKAHLLRHLLPALAALAHRVRKIRITGSAALDLAYVASGRFDAFLEAGLRLWDIAAGGLMVECAGGTFWHRPLPGGDAYAVAAHNGHLWRGLAAHVPVK
ncbi:MAG: inositol monophosphatase [Verrucomicrobia bacterium]|nr:inositol monophosphatase [Verrucomicrobiota bacterium]